METAGPDARRPAVRVSQVSKRFPVAEGLSPATARESQVRGGFFYALEDVSLEVEAGACVIIAGANGSGKSLLMQIIAGLEEASAGEVRAAGRVGIVFQDVDSQILGETPREDVALGLKARGVRKQEIKALTEEALEHTGLLSRGDFPARFLSGGEKRRLAVAAALALDSGVIIFDEPYLALDYRGVIEVNRQILHLKEMGKTILIVSHELEKCLAFGEKLIVLDKGRIVFQGGPRELFCDDREPGNFADWNIHDPLAFPRRFEDLVWL